jgi:hypothetical protein
MQEWRVERGNEKSVIRREQFSSDFHGTIYQGGRLVGDYHGKLGEKATATTFLHIHTYVRCMQNGEVVGEEGT